MWMQFSTISLLLLLAPYADAAEFVCRSEIGVRCTSAAAGCWSKEISDLPTVITLDTKTRLMSECYKEVGCGNFGEIIHFQQSDRAILVFALGRATTQQFSLDRNDLMFRKVVGILGDETEIVWGKCDLLSN
ncbi:MAG: hypothetical protein IOC86_02470 [Aestuariivirga sp.]|nr:hypothetical protein [Aestuariivirga sp.]